MRALLPLGLLSFVGCASTGSTVAQGESSPSQALQPDFFSRAVAPFSVSDREGRPYAHPFLGGFDVPRPQFIDIDGDGDLDLFVQERSDEIIFFENVGTAQAPALVWRTDDYLDLDGGDWSRFVDLDRDGDFDLLTEERFSYIRYYRNDGNASAPLFTLIGDSVRSDLGEPIFADRQNIPNVSDIDGDGRWDLFLGRVDGTVRRYELVDFDLGEAPRFTLVAERFEDIEIVAQIGSMHGANSMDFADADGDGDEDLFWGDFFEPSILLIENRGTPTNPNLRTEPTPVQASDSVSTSGYNVPVWSDLDGDGDEDLFVGVLGGAFNPNRTAGDNFYFYERDDSGRLERRSRRFISGIDVGSESIPVFGDLDGDGDLDLLVSNKLDPGNLNASRTHYFENTGNPSAPAFRLAEELVFDSTYHYSPALGDLDGDGDPDLLLGTWNKGLSYYRNNASEDGLKFELVDEGMVQLTRGSNSTPALVDIDADGDLDLFVGEASGELNFFRNVGTASEPSFSLESDDYLEIDVGRRSHPFLLDVDRDGDFDLILGREVGGSEFYRNVGSVSEPSFEPAPTPLPALPNFSTPQLVDIDSDGDLDLFSGGLSGGVVFYENRSSN